MHKRTCPESNSNKLKEMANLVQNLTDTNQALNLEIENLKLRIQQIEVDVRTQTFVIMSNLLNLASNLKINNILFLTLSNLLRLLCLPFLIITHDNNSWSRLTMISYYIVIFLCIIFSFFYSKLSEK